MAVMMTVHSFDFQARHNRCLRLVARRQQPGARARGPIRQDQTTARPARRWRIRSAEHGVGLWCRERLLPV